MNRLLLRSLRHAWSGSLSRANNLASGAGALLLTAISLVTGWKMPAPEGALGLLVSWLFEAVAIWVCIFAGRAVYAPLHFALESHGGLVSLTQKRMGSLMAPILLMIASFLAFLGVFTGSSIWLLLRMKSDSIPFTEITQASQQPDFTLDPPSAAFVIQWDPSTSMEMKMRKEGQLNVSPWDSVGFLLKNKLPHPVADVNVTWNVNISDIQKMTESSELFKRVKVAFQNGSIYLNGSGVPGWVYKETYVSQYSLPFINKDTELYLPIQLDGPALAYFVANMPKNTGDRSPPLTYSVKIAWSIPSGGRDQEFLVTAVVINTKPSNLEQPLISGRIEFRVERVR